MSKLIDELKQHHVFIQQHLERVKALGAESAEGRAALLAFKANLLAHLAKEDEQLYPVLEVAARHDHRLADLLSVFRDDISRVARGAIAFFDSFESGKLKGLQLAREVGTLAGQLSLRIGKEESVLYAAYDKVAGAQEA